VAHPHCFHFLHKNEGVPCLSISSCRFPRRHGPSLTSRSMSSVSYRKQLERYRGFGLLGRKAAERAQQFLCCIGDAGGAHPSRLWFLRSVGFEGSIFRADPVRKGKLLSPGARAALGKCIQKLTSTVDEAILLSQQDSFASCIYCTCVVNEKELLDMFRS
jgi:hypothetical protein